MGSINGWGYPYKTPPVPIRGYVPNYTTPSRSEVESKKTSIEELYNYLGDAHQKYCDALRFVRDELKDLGYSEKKVEDIVQQFVERYKQNSDSLTKFIDELAYK